MNDDTRADAEAKPRRHWDVTHGNPRHTDWGKEWHARRWHKRRRWFFGRAFGFIGFLALLIGGGMAILAMLLTRIFGGAFVPTDLSTLTPEEQLSHAMRAHGIDPPAIHLDGRIHRFKVDASDKAKSGWLRDWSL